MSSSRIDIPSSQILPVAVVAGGLNAAMNFEKIADVADVVDIQTIVDLPKESH